MYSCVELYACLSICACSADLQHTNYTNLKAVLVITLAFNLN